MTDPAPGSNSSGAHIEVSPRTDGALRAGLLGRDDPRVVLVREALAAFENMVNENGWKETTPDPTLFVLYLSSPTDVRSVGDGEVYMVTSDAHVDEPEVLNDVLEQALATADRDVERALRMVSRVVEKTLAARSADDLLGVFDGVIFHGLGLRATGTAPAIGATNGETVALGLLLFFGRDGLTWTLSRQLETPATLQMRLLLPGESAGALAQEMCKLLNLFIPVPVPVPGLHRDQPGADGT